MPEGVCRGENLQAAPAVCPECDARHGGEPGLSQGAQGDVAARFGHSVGGEPLWSGDSRGPRVESREPRAERKESGFGLGRDGSSANDDVTQVAHSRELRGEGRERCFGIGR